MKVTTLNPGDSPVSCYLPEVIGKGLLLMCLVLLGSSAPGAELSDAFADRELITSESGQLDGDTTLASFEVGEPRHGGRPGGHSVWVDWVATKDGIATFWTEASSFDTLLSAYYFASPSDTGLARLKEAARSDDDPLTAPASLIQFGALAGTRYSIAVDGYRGSAGSIRLRWSFVDAASPPPIIVSLPDDQAARQGDRVTLTVDVPVSPKLHLQWRLNGEDYFDEDQPTLVIPSLQTSDLGLYTLRIRLDDVRFTTSPVEVQINSDGQTNALARDKLLDAVESPLVGRRDEGEPSPPPRNLVGLADLGDLPRGYNGSQIFNTTYATTDANEPEHCGEPRGATYWFAYQAPVDGTVTLDTVGSTYDTLLAVYSYAPPVTDYAQLVPVVCDNNNAAAQGAARVEFAVLSGRQYAVAVQGVNGARGIAHLNYRMDIQRLPVPPTLMEPTVARASAAGESVTLQAPIAGSLPLHFSWQKAGTLLPEATNAMIVIPAAAPSHSGDYILTVSNHVGAPLRVVFPLRVLIPPKLEMSRHGAEWVITALTTAGQRYTVERASNWDGTWTVLLDDFSSSGAPLVITNRATDDRSFFRMRTDSF